MHNDIYIVLHVDSYLRGYLGSRFHENLVIKIGITFEINLETNSFQFEKNSEIKIQYQVVS